MTNDPIGAMLDEIVQLLGVYCEVRLQRYFGRGGGRYLCACSMGDGDGGIYEAEFIGDSFVHATKGLLDKVRKDFEVKELK